MIDCNVTLKETLDTILDPKTGKPAVPYEEVPGKGIDYNYKLRSVFRELLGTKIKPDGKIGVGELRALLKKAGVSDKEIKASGLEDKLVVAPNKQHPVPDNIGLDVQILNSRFAGEDDRILNTILADIYRADDDELATTSKVLLTDVERVLKEEYGAIDAVRESLDRYTISKLLARHGINSEKPNKEVIKRVKDKLELFVSKTGEDKKSVEVAKLIEVLENKRQDLYKEVIEEVDADYADVTYSKYGREDYKETLFNVNEGAANGSKTPSHFLPLSRDQFNLGWHRAHFSDDRSKLILNELQSDMLQKTADKDKKFMDKVKFDQLAIVDAIDQAIKADVQEIVIPLDRETKELVGSPQVTKFYYGINKYIMPGIRKQLKKYGIDIDTSISKGAPPSKPTTTDILKHLSMRPSRENDILKYQHKFLDNLSNLGNKEAEAEAAKSFEQLYNLINHEYDFYILFDTSPDKTALKINGKPPEAYSSDIINAIKAEASRLNKRDVPIGASGHPYYDSDKLTQGGTTALRHTRHAFSKVSELITNIDMDAAEPNTLRLFSMIVYAADNAMSRDEILGRLKLVDGVPMFGKSKISDLNEADKQFISTYIEVLTDPELHRALFKTDKEYEQAVKDAKPPVESELSIKINASDQKSKARWDVYGVIGALGLGSQIDNDK